MLPRSWSTCRTSLPWRRRTLRRRISGSLWIISDRLGRLASATDLVHQPFVVLIDSTAWFTSRRRKTAPVLATLAVWTVTSHVASVTADATDDVGGEVAGVWAVVLAMSYLAAVLAGLVLVVAEGTVESCELAELVALELVLAFWDGSSLHIHQ